MTYSVTEVGSGARGRNNWFMVFLQKHWLRGTAICLLTIFCVTLLIIASGVFDPKPIGTVQPSLYPGEQTIGAGAEEVHWLDVSLAGGKGSVRGTAVFLSGEQDIQYGLIIGEPDQYVQVVASPLGYVAISKLIINQQFTIPDSSYLFPFQPWPHVHTGAALNEIWVEWDEGNMTVRINRELVWEGEVGIDPRSVGLVVRSYGETAVVDFQTVELFLDR
jgi:hypothetical protein